MRVGLVVPHIFIGKAILPHVIFSPGTLALQLASDLQAQGVDVTLFSPGPADTRVRNVTADMSLFEAELAARGDSYLDLLKKHPLTFTSLARQVQAELIARAYAMANDGQLDVVHVYTNEEDTALPFAQFCRRPVVFTHHDPFRLLIPYKSSFPKYRQLNWISLSHAQRRDMPADTNWVANIYHGLPTAQLMPARQPAGDYLAFVGRIIQPKGAHLAIRAVQAYNRAHPERPYRLKLAGKHYAGHRKDTYWQEQIEPLLADPAIEYVGFVRDAARQELLAGAAGLLVPSLFEEPFGLVSIEALACGTPVIGSDSGALPEIIKDGQTGLVVKITTNDDKVSADDATAQAFAAAIETLPAIDRRACRADFEQRFTSDRMAAEHLAAYEKLVRGS